MLESELIAVAKPHFNENQIGKMRSAIKVATIAHEGQFRNSGEPYIIHPLSVAKILTDWDMDIDTIIAGVLHDVVEDTKVTLADIEKQFGRDIAFLVDGVTKVSQARSGMRDIDSYLPQTKDNLTKLLIAIGQDVRVIIIKLADRLHNMRTLEYKTREKQKKIARETMEVFAPLADRLNMGRVRVQLEELSFEYLMPKDFNRTKTLMESRIKKSQRKMNRVRSKVTDRLNQEKIDFQMDGRIKSIYSLFKKLDRVSGDIDQIHDLIALRIIVVDFATSYLVLSALHDMYTPLYERIKDYVSQPKENGYQSLHTTVETDLGQIVEFQVRTKEMHDYAETGLAASFHYNEQKMTDAYRKKRIQELPEQLKWIKDLQLTASKASNGGEKGLDRNKLRMNLFNNRIFVFSPKGDIWDLPRGSYPLDFAYRVHSDLASRASGFRINGAMKPFSYELQHGDQVEILTSKGASPKEGWKEFIRTSHAKDKLRLQLSKQSRSLLDRFTAPFNRNRS